MPLRLLVCVPALSVTVNVPVNVPAAVGWNMTKTVQLAPADNENEVPHWLNTANGPVTVSLVTDTVVVPLFFNVNDCHAVAVPAGIVPKFKLAGLRLTVPPPAAFTVSETAVVWVRAPEVPVMVIVDVPVVAVALAAKVTTLVEVAGLVPKVAVTPAGKPEAERLTLPAKPPDGVTVTVLLALVP